MDSRPTKILMIEDDTVDQMAFERFAIAEHFPYEYLITGSIQATRQLLQTGQPIDLVVADYLLGDGIALELFDELQDIPIIIVTGFGNEEIAVNAMKAGAYDYLIKDQDGNYLKILAVTIEQALKRQSTEAELQRHKEHLEELVVQRTAELQQEIAERKRAEAKLQHTLNDLEVLFRELHHRVKNNLQVVSSLLDLQSLMIEDRKVQDMFLESQNRILSIAQLHEMLYKSAHLAELDLPGYFRQLARSVLQSYGRPDIALQIAVENIALDIDTAMTCGLIINELLSNTLKHAFPPAGCVRAPEIGVALKAQPAGAVALEVRDNGVGLPDKHTVDQWQASFGLRLISMLTQQLKGSLQFTTDAGTCVRVTFTPEFKPKSPR